MKYTLSTLKKGKEKMNNKNNNSYIPIYSAVDTILIAATITMAILKYNAGYDIPTIVVFTPLIVIAILFGIKIITAIIALVVITFMDIHEGSKIYHNSHARYENAPKIYWNPKTKEMEGVEPMPEYEKWKDVE